MCLENIKTFFFFFNRPLFLVSFILQSVCTRTRGIKLYPVNHWTALSNSIRAPLSLVNSCSILLPWFQRFLFFHPYPAPPCLASFVPLFFPFIHPSIYFLLSSCPLVIEKHQQRTGERGAFLLLNVPTD